MRKFSLILLTAVFLLAVSGIGYTQTNTTAFFRIDTDLANAGFQANNLITGIAGGKYVGFAIYIKNYDALRSYAIDVTWDSAKATFNSTFSSNVSTDNGVAINGMTLAEEGCLLTNPLESPGTINNAGHFYTLFAQAGGSTLSSSEYGLAYVVVLKTATTFTTATQLDVNVNVKLTTDDPTQVKDLGTRHFYLNSGYTDVKTSPWGEVKSQFKN